MMENEDCGFDPWLWRWHLEPAGEAIDTPTARLLPVNREGRPAMLKVARDRSERGAEQLLQWWAGEGAARVLECEAEALLIERATGPLSLARMSRSGEDDEATIVLCSVIQTLHRPRREATPPLGWLDEWFHDLWPGAADSSGWQGRAAGIARDLLTDPREAVALHGDIHHGNVLDFGPRGWLAIDPKRLWGERCFDYAALFANPDKARPDLVIGRDPGRFDRRLAIVTEHAGIDRGRLIAWIMAWSGLSALWSGPGSAQAAIDATIFELASRARSG